MGKETVRYPEETIEIVEDLVSDDVFESKSEFYRQTAEYVTGLLENMDPEEIQDRSLEKILSGDYSAVEDALRVGMAGIASRDLSLACSGGQRLSELDEDLGEVFAHYVAWIDEDYWEIE